MAIFGQNPADITGAIFKSKNFSDVPDKTAARNNLNVPSKDEVLYNSVPIGMILPYWGTVAPAGYLPCSGQTITSGTFPELVTFLGGGSSQVLPDLRGEFLRGWDDGRGVDTGRAIKTWQADELKAHTHKYGNTHNATYGLSSTGVIGVNPTTSINYDTSSVGGSETRPRNVSVLYCIKAYSSIANYTSSLNIAGLVNDFSTLSSAAVKYADFQGTNQGLTANGWQKLPGGVILQWITTSHTGENISATLPTAFPNACLFAGVNMQTDNGAAVVMSRSTTTLSGSALISATNATGTNTYNWLALGY